MVGDQYKVLKDIPEGLQSGANAGDILVSKIFYRIEALFKDGLAVCDIDSAACKEDCIKID